MPKELKRKKTKLTKKDEDTAEESQIIKRCLGTSDSLENCWPGGPVKCWSDSRCNDKTDVRIYEKIEGNLFLRNKSSSSKAYIWIESEREELSTSEENYLRELGVKEIFIYKKDKTGSFSHHETISYSSFESLQSPQSRELVISQISPKYQGTQEYSSSRTSSTSGYSYSKDNEYDYGFIFTIVCIVIIATILITLVFFEPIDDKSLFSRWMNSGVSIESSPSLMSSVMSPSLMSSII